MLQTTTDSLRADKTGWSGGWGDWCVWACVARQWDACDGLLQRKQRQMQRVNWHTIFHIRSGSLTSGYRFAQPDISFIGYRLTSLFYNTPEPTRGRFIVFCWWSVQNGTGIDFTFGLMQVNPVFGKIFQISSIGTARLECLSENSSLCIMIH